MFLFAQFTTLLSGAISYPFDTVMHRLMMQAGREDKIYKGLINCFSVISRDEGIRGFYKGFSVRILSGIGGAFLLTFYDKLTRS